MPTVYEQCDAIVAATEGGLSTNRADPGNWTGGAVGAGELRGTKYGIAASAHPDVDIANLTLQGAEAIRKPEYWDKIAGDRLPPPLALLVYDAAINNGAGRAARWLQAAAGVEQDGAIGDATLTAVLASSDGVALMARFMALRLAFMSRLPTWPQFGASDDYRPLGWAERLSLLPFQAFTIAAAPAA
jgi:lysozyme family protein